MRREHDVWRMSLYRFEIAAQTLELLKEESKSVIHRQSYWDLGARVDERKESCRTSLLSIPSHDGKR